MDNLVDSSCHDMPTTVEYLDRQQHELFISIDSYR